MATPRWTQLRFHAMQAAWWNSPHRFNLVPAGRRSGKTENAKRKIIIRAMMPPEMGGSSFLSPRYFCAAPTRDQAKRIYWDDLKAMTPVDWLAAQPSESELSLTFVNGAKIIVLGMDKPERIEGSPWDGGILDEYGNMKPHAWGAHVRPALADRKGWCDLIGVPEGRNHYYDMCEKAKASLLEEGRDSEWGFFTWFSSDILDAQEIAAARKDLDELTFKQEYEASFINFEGQTYYNFSDNHKARLDYDPRLPLIFCFDFNVDPGVAVICQEQKLPNGESGTAVLGEVWVDRNSNSEIVARRLCNDWGHHQGYVYCYGDATGGGRGSAKIMGSDWDIVRFQLLREFSDRLIMKIPAANPPERTRVNAMNVRMRNGEKRIRMMVDPAKAPHVVKDLEGVRCVPGGSGEIDKRYDRRLTHISDALGYYIVAEFPISSRNAVITKTIGV